MAYKKVDDILFVYTVMLNASLIRIDTVYTMLSAFLFVG